MNAEHDLDRRLTLVETETVHPYDLIDERTKRLAADISEVRTTIAEHSLTLAEHGQQLDRVAVTLTEHGQALTEILRRLPEPTV